MCKFSINYGFGSISPFDTPDLLRSYINVILFYDLNHKVKQVARRAYAPEEILEYWNDGFKGILLNKN